MPYSTLNETERAERLNAGRLKGGLAARDKLQKQKAELPWPKVGKKTWDERLNGRRFDEPGMVVRFKSDKR